MPSPSLAASRIVPPLPRSERGRPAKMDVSAQGDLVAFPSARVISVLRVADLSVHFIARHHRFDTTAVRFSPNGELVASGDCGGEVFVWQCSEPFEMKYKHVIGGEVADVAWSPDGTKLAVVGDGRPVYFDIKSGSSGADLSCHSRRIEAIAIHPSEKEKLILMASHDSRVSVFDKSNGGYRPKYAQLLTAHNKEVYCVSFNEDGSLFASGGADGRLVVYDTLTKTRVAERQHDRSITSAVFVCIPSLEEGDGVDDGKRQKEMLVYSSTDGAIRALRCFSSSDIDENGEWEEVIEEWEKKEEGVQRLALAASPSYGFVFALNSNGRLDKLRVSDGGTMVSLHGHKGHLKAVDIDDGWTVTGDNSGRLCIDGGKSVQSFGPESNIATRGVAILAKEGIVMALRLNNQLECISLTDGSLLSSSPLPSEPRSISKGKHTVAVLCHNHLLIVDRKTKEVIVEETLSMDPTDISMLFDGSEVAVGDSTGAVTVFSLSGSTLSVAHKLKQKGAISTLEYSPEGSHLGVADGARYVSVYRRADWSVMADDWRVHNASIRCMGWSPDGERLATGSIDRSLIVWSLYEADKKFDPLVIKSGHIPEALTWNSFCKVVTVGEDGCRIHWKLE